jgi:hypothetical protein
VAPTSSRSGAANSRSSLTAWRSVEIQPRSSAQPRSGRFCIRDDPAEAERVGSIAFEQNRAAPWHPHYGTPEQIADHLAPYVEPGYRHLIANFPAPYDEESVTRYATEVRALLGAAPRPLGAIS